MKFISNSIFKSNTKVFQHQNLFILLLIFFPLVSCKKFVFDDIIYAKLINIIKIDIPGYQIEYIAEAQGLLIHDNIKDRKNEINLINIHCSKSKNICNIAISKIADTYNENKKTLEVINSLVEIKEWKGEERVVAYNNYTCTDDYWIIDNISQNMQYVSKPKKLNKSEYNCIDEYKVIKKHIADSDEAFEQYLNNMNFVFSF